MSSDKALRIKERAFELDLLRGITIIWVVFMHFSFDMRYILGLDVFSYLSSKWYWTFGETLVLCIFVGLSGVCCSLSRSNLKRGIKLLVVSVAITIATYLADKFFHLGCLILFNVLHVLTCGILLYCLISFIEKKLSLNPKAVSVIMSLFGLWIAMIGKEIHRYNGTIDGNWLLPFGIYGKTYPEMGDYMPLFPWLGIFLLGAVIGRSCYSDKKTVFPNANDKLLRFFKPVMFIGRHTLIIYLVHQPLVLGIAYLVFFSL